mmetsp:Transcript_85398/g.215296  ORF Transcript_85398/g.215296 Transcript_85398/m.215296 type:complete len:227 (-) Transcript_85398:275-955(-)
MKSAGERRLLVDQRDSGLQILPAQTQRIGALELKDPPPLLHQFALLLRILLLQRHCDGKVVDAAVQRLQLLERRLRPHEPRHVLAQQLLRHGRVPQRLLELLVADPQLLQRRVRRAHGPLEDPTEEVHVDLEHLPDSQELVIAEVSRLRALDPLLQRRLQRSAGGLHGARVLSQELTADLSVRVVLFLLRVVRVLQQGKVLCPEEACPGVCAKQVHGPGVSPKDVL